MFVTVRGYSDSKGDFLQLVRLLCSIASLRVSQMLDIDDIYIGNGVSEMIPMSMQALLDDGDEVLVPMPDYPLWTACVSLAGGNAVHYVCDEKSNWYPDIDDIKSKITSNTKAIVIINPNNPTGALYPKDVLEQIVDIARQNDLIIFADEIYDRLVMDGKKHIAIASLAPDVFCVSMNGLSKSHRICGFRVGWMVLSGPKKNVRGYIEGLDMLSNMRLCSNVLSQHVIQTSLGGYQSVDELLIPYGRIYEQREFITNTVNDIPGLTAVKARCGSLHLPKIDRNMYDIDDDEEFCLRLLKKEKVLLVRVKALTGMNRTTSVLSTFLVWKNWLILEIKSSVFCHIISAKFVKNWTKDLFGFYLLKGVVFS